MLCDLQSLAPQYWECHKAQGQAGEFFLPHIQVYNQAWPLERDLQAECMFDVLDPGSILGTMWFPPTVCWE